MIDFTTVTILTTLIFSFALVITVYLVLTKSKPGTDIEMDVKEGKLRIKREK